MGVRARVLVLARWRAGVSVRVCPRVRVHLRLPLLLRACVRTSVHVRACSFCASAHLDASAFMRACVYVFVCLRWSNSIPILTSPGRFSLYLFLNRGDAHASKLNRSPWLPDFTRLKCPTASARLFLSHDRDSPAYRDRRV